MTRRSIPLGLKSVTKENIANYVRRCRNYMFAYLEGSAVGHEIYKWYPRLASRGACASESVTNTYTTATTRHALSYSTHTGKALQK